MLVRQCTRHRVYIKLESIYLRLEISHVRRVLFPQSAKWAIICRTTNSHLCLMLYRSKIMFVCTKLRLSHSLPLSRSAELEYFPSKLRTLNSLLEIYSEQIFVFPGIPTKYRAIKTNYSHTLKITCLKNTEIINLVDGKRTKRICNITVKRTFTPFWLLKSVLKHCTAIFIWKKRRTQKQFRNEHKVLK